MKRNMHWLMLWLVGLVALIAVFVLVKPLLA